MQLVIFLSFWSILLLLTQFTIPFYFRTSFGITADKLSAFLADGIYKYPDAIFVSNALSAVGIFLLPACIYAYLADPQPFRYLGLVRPERRVQLFWVGLLAVAMIFFITPMAAWIKELDLGSTSKTLDETRARFISSYLTQGNTWTIIRSVVLIAVIPAICEEFFFRGTLMKMLHSFVPKWWFSIGISALVFAGFHFSLSELGPIFIAGVILGTVYYLTSSLWLSIMLHLLFNGIQAVGSIYATAEVDTYIESGANMLIIFGAAAALVGFCLYFLFKNKTPLPAGWSMVVPEVAEEADDSDD